MLLDIAALSLSQVYNAVTSPTLHKAETISASVKFSREYKTLGNNFTRQTFGLPHFEVSQTYFPAFHILHQLYERCLIHVSFYSYFHILPVSAAALKYIYHHVGFV